MGNYGGNLFIREEDEEIIYGGVEILSAKNVKYAEDTIIWTGNRTDIVCQVESNDIFNGVVGIGNAGIPLDTFLNEKGVAYLNGNQDFWISFFYQENSTILYTVFLNSDFYSREDLIALINTIHFSEKAFY